MMRTTLLTACILFTLGSTPGRATIPTAHEAAKDKVKALRGLTHYSLILNGLGFTHGDPRLPTPKISADDIRKVIRTSLQQRNIPFESDASSPKAVGYLDIEFMPSRNQKHGDFIIMLQVKRIVVTRDEPITEASAVVWHSVPYVGRSEEESRETLTRALEEQCDQLASAYELAAAP